MMFIDRYLAEAVVCTKDYEAVCSPHTNTLFKMMRKSYNPVCKYYKTGNSIRIIISFYIFIIFIRLFNL